MRVELFRGWELSHRPPGSPSQPHRRHQRSDASSGSSGSRLAHEPFGWRPTALLVTIRRYRCAGCGHVWRQDTSHATQLQDPGPRKAVQARGFVGPDRLC
ncbi:hypothetical protein GCM10010178_17500 [Lentzea flava]|uniref:Zinc-finger of transposase IS204/IS1001/IS1096/IS1165 n=1 Tax=Lentzea flava TaxID=103732 RepID=A0ABQ2UFK7_9PSEU|nr:hypothetical protein GCM10010178_17500 [Lentzea flava]